MKYFDEEDAITEYEKQLQKKDKEIERLNNKVEELMELYITEREVKEDYKSIIKEVRECIENQPSSLVQSEINIIKILDKVENK